MTEHKHASAAPASLPSSETPKLASLSEPNSAAATDPERSHAETPKVEAVLPNEPTSIIRPRAKLSSNGNGNGHTNGTGNGHTNGTGNGHAAEVSQRLLQLHIPAADYDTTIRLMQSVRGVLEACLAGEQGDQIIICLLYTSRCV